MAVKMPIIASDTTITSRSIVSHWGMRFAGCWVIGCVLRDPYFMPEECKWL